MPEQLSAKLLWLPLLIYVRFPAMPTVTPDEKCEEGRDDGCALISRANAFSSSQGLWAALLAVACLLITGIGLQVFPRFIIPEGLLGSDLGPSQHGGSLSKQEHCEAVNYAALDPPSFESMLFSTGGAERIVVHRVSNLQVQHLGTEKATVHAPADCFHRLQQDVAAPTLTDKSIGSYSTDGPQCKRVSGAWLLITVGHTNNIYDNLSREWYQAWLALRALEGTSAPLPQNISITHIRSAPPTRFLPIYHVFGQYVPWENVAENRSGPLASCHIFEEAILPSQAWLWSVAPVRAAPSPQLRGFVDATLGRLNLTEARPDECRPVALFAKRAHSPGKNVRYARFVINTARLESAMKSALPGFLVENKDLATLSFAESVKAVRQASIFVFAHGGAGPNVIWMHPGAVAIELFPWMTAGPYYRNLAVLTGKVYLSWQAQHFADSNASVGDPGYQRGGTRGGSYHFSPTSAFYIDPPELERVFRSALDVVRLNLGLNWAPANADRFNSDLMPWGRSHQLECQPGS